MFVKKKAPLGRKAERKWRIADLGLELILRAKKAAAVEADASAAEVSVLRGSEGVCSRSFVVVTHSGAAEVVRSLLRGGIALAYALIPLLVLMRSRHENWLVCSGRVEQEDDSGAGLLRFGARAGASDADTGEQAFFLLQMESRPPPQPEPEPEPEPQPEPGADAVAACEWECTVRTTHPDLLELFEDCVHAQLSAVPSFSHRVPIAGGGADICFSLDVSNRAAFE